MFYSCLTLEINLVLDLDSLSSKTIMNTKITILSCIVSMNLWVFHENGGHHGGHLLIVKTVFDVIFEFLDPQNIYVDTKIIILLCIVNELQRINDNGGQFDRHLEYYRLPKGATSTSTWILSGNTYIWIIKSRITFIRNIKIT